MKRLIWTTLVLFSTIYHAVWFNASAQEVFDPALFETLKIRNVGPANMSGRITAIDVVNSDKKIIYLGAASGGVWKSENGGSAWTSIFDDNPTVNIGAIAIQQSNPAVVWVGTGEGNPRNSMNLGMGIFKSLDGGKTWKHMGLEATKTIHRIIVDPNDPNTVYVGAMGDPFTPNEHRGLYMTKDGGESWVKILYTNQQSGVGDMVMDPSNPNKIFVGMYEHRRTPYSFTSGGPGSGIFVTIDGGKNWDKLDHTTGLPAGDLGRVGLAIAPSNTEIIYAKVEATRNALYKSENGGATWKMINDNPKFTNNRPFYFQDLAVDSKDPNRLYNIYQPLSVSYDGGLSFDPTPMIPADETKGIHADFHAFWMNKDDPNHFIIGGDGGIGITYDKGVSWYFPESIPVAQCYHIGVDNEIPYNVYAGMQDNGNWSGPGYTWKRGGIRTLYWQYLVGGDGFYISPDAPDARFGYGTSQNGNLYRYDKLTGYYISIKPPAVEGLPRLRFNWNAGFARDPFNDMTAYYGSQFVHKTTDNGNTWSVISPDLTTNNPQKQKLDNGGLTIDASGAEFYNSILSIAPSRLNPDVLWVGTDDGNVQLTEDGGVTWSNMTTRIKGLPHESWIAQIKISPSQPGGAWVVANNYRLGDYKPYLFKTEDFGKTWKQMCDPNVIKGYALSVIQDPVEPNLIFLGTENGLWISIDGGENWAQVKNGLPSVSTMDLKIQERESALIIGTFGRAIWILDDLKSLRALASGKLQSPITVIEPNTAVQVKGLFINPPGNIWTGFNTTFEGENRPFKKVAIPYFVSKVRKGATIAAKISDNNGRLIQEVLPNDEVKEGLNYMYWKLDEKITRLPNAYVNEESRGIPVLPGNYTVVVSYGGEKDSTSVDVISDPRFDLNPEVDVALYGLQKQLNDLRKPFVRALGQLQRCDSISQNVEDQLTKLRNDDLKDLMTLTTKIRSQIKQLMQLGLGKRPEKQLGAWQSIDVTISSKIREAEKSFRSKMVLPSHHDEDLFNVISKMVDDYEMQVDSFLKKEWKEYKKKVNGAKLNWFE